MLVAIAVLLIGAIAACFVDRLGAPTLLLFLGLGMLLGEDGPGGITFDDATLVRDAGSVALALILLEGGVLANVPAIRRVIRPSVLLATLGVLITAGIASLAAHWALDLHWRTALLIGAVVSSTDAAAVFAAVRNVGLRHRVESVLELESGVNDPFAAILVIGLVEWQRHDHYGVADAALLLVREAGLGLLGGALIGVVAVWLLRRLPLPSAGIAPVLVVGVALAGYASITALGGSGLLTAYLIGLAVGDTRIPHAGVVRGFLQGGAWLAQIGLFVLLGLLVTPSRLPDEGLAPLVVAIALVLVARPLAVLVCTTPFRIPWREQAFLAWAGLRGGVPIVFATIPIAAGTRERRAGLRRRLLRRGRLGGRAGVDAADGRTAARRRRDEAGPAAGRPRHRHAPDPRGRAHRATPRRPCDLGWHGDPLAVPAGRGDHHRDPARRRAGRAARRQRPAARRPALPAGRARHASGELQTGLEIAAG